MLTIFFLGGASATLPVSRHLTIKRWIVFLSGTLFLPKSLLHFSCARRTDFVAKYASMIFIRCCIVNHPAGSILVLKESSRSAVYTTWKIWKSIVKHNFGMKSKMGSFFGPPWYIYFSLQKKLQFKLYINKTDRKLETIIR